MVNIKPTVLSVFGLGQRVSSAKVADACGRLAAMVPYALIVLLPLTFWLGTNNIFDLPKVTLLRLATLLALLAWLARASLLGRIVIWPTPLLRPVVAYAGVLALATAFSQAPVVSLFGISERHDGLLTQLNFIVLFFITANLFTTGRQVRRALQVHTLTATAVAALGVLQYFGVGAVGLDADYWGYRAFSTLGNPDFFGTYLVLALPAAIGLALARRTGQQTAIWTGATFLIAAGLLLSFTRGAWVGALASLLMLGWLLRARVWAARRWMAALLLAVVVAGLVTQMHWLDPLRINNSSGKVAANTTPSVGEVAASAFALEHGTASSRLLIWRGTLDLIRDNPVLGVGLNASMGAFSRYAPAEYAAGEGLRSFPDKAHNELLHAAATTGLVGLGTYLWLIAAIGLVVWRALRRLKDGEERVMLASLAATGLGFLAQAMFLFPVIDTGALAWMIVALTAVLAGRKTAPALQAKLPAWSRAWVLLAAALIGIWLGALATKPLVADALARQGDLLQKGLHGDGGEAVASKMTQAMERYREAIAWYPYDEQYYRRLAIALRVRAAITTDRTRRRELLDEAVSSLTNAIVIDPKMAGLYFDRGFTYQSFGDDHRVDALNDYRKAVKLYPFYYAANRALADLARQMKRSDEGIIAQLNMLAVRPNDLDTLLKLGDDYLLMGRADEAVRTWEQATQLETAQVAPFLRLGRAHSIRGDSEGARVAFERALAIDPKSEEAQRALKPLSDGGKR